MYDSTVLVIDGKRWVLSGSIHFPWATPEVWPGLTRKSKEGGLDVIETYVFRNYHKPIRGQYYFEGRFDLVRFVKTVQDAGLYVHLRIGPYACAEWNYGYHIPCSWVYPGKNLLVLHEELGGDPLKITVLTKTGQEICAYVFESDPHVDSWKPSSAFESLSPEIQLSCEQGWDIVSVSFASFGTPKDNVESSVMDGAGQMMFS